VRGDTAPLLRLLLAVVPLTTFNVDPWEGFVLLRLMPRLLVRLTALLFTLPNVVCEFVVEGADQAPRLTCEGSGGLWNPPATGGGVVGDVDVAGLANDRGGGFEVAVDVAVDVTANVDGW
jgi:hypothetical protein